MSMTDDRALAALVALAHGTRLGVLRLLLRQGPDGMPAGEIARATSVPPSTLSSHLAQLEGAGLLRSCGLGSASTLDVVGIRALMSFLVADCCRGRPGSAPASPISGPRSRRARKRVTINAGRGWNFDWGGGAEWLGTLLLLAVVVGSGIMGETLSGGNVAIALLPTGAILVCSS